MEVCRMTREEAIYQLELCKSIIYASGRDWLDERDIPMLDTAIEALEFLNTYDRRWEEIKTAGMQGKEVSINHGGRLFKIREVAQ